MRAVVSQEVGGMPAYQHAAVAAQIAHLSVGRIASPTTRMPWLVVLPPDDQIARYRFLTMKTGWRPRAMIMGHLVAGNKSKK